MPLHVVAGFLLSERRRSDSGVWGMKGIGRKVRPVADAQKRCRVQRRDVSCLSAVSDGASLHLDR